MNSRVGPILGRRVILLGKAARRYAWHSHLLYALIEALTVDRVSHWAKLLEAGDWLLEAKDMLRNKCTALADGSRISRS